MLEGVVMLVKICTKCKIEKTVDCFNKHSGTKDKLQHHCNQCRQRYRQENKEAIAAWKKADYEQNKERILSVQKKYYSDNREKVIHTVRLYNKNNRDKILAKQKIYQKKHLDRWNANKARRKATKLQATPLWADNKAISGLYKLASLFNKTGINLHVDHIIPLQSDVVCGLHCEANLQLLPSSDNISKGNRWWPDMW
jgi:hypothetical protein